MIMDFLGRIRNRAFAEADANFRECRCWLLFFALVAIIGCQYSTAAGKSGGDQPLRAPDQGPQAEFWRLPENDGINCLYLQLRLLGYDGSYQTFRRQTSDAGNFQTLNSLASLARRLGFQLLLRKLTASEFASIRGPVLVHMEHGGISSGAFSLFLYGDGRSVVLVRGLSMRRRQMPSDSFERAWTGYALVPRQTRNWYALARRCVAILLISYVVVLLLHDRKTATRFSRPNQ